MTMLYRPTRMCQVDFERTKVLGGRVHTVKRSMWTPSTSVQARLHPWGPLFGLCRERRYINIYIQCNNTIQCVYIGPSDHLLSIILKKHQNLSLYIIYTCRPIRMCTFASLIDTRVCYTRIFTLVSIMLRHS